MRFLFIITVLLIVFSGWINVQAHELSAEFAVENTIFFESGRYDNQETYYPSARIQPEYYHPFENGISLTACIFARYDYTDSQRSHADIRELMINYPLDNIEINFGIGKTFWGATEFYHLIDIINQTDLVEANDGEEKLGQPMLHLSFTPDWGNLDFYALPYFRERTFPGKNGRFRSALVVDTDNATYRSSAEQNNFDFSMRYSRTIGDADFGIYYFNGTNRIPQLIEENRDNAENVLIPYYDLIQQIGTDLQLVSGRWQLKFEGIYQNGGEQDYFAFTTGVEYTFQSILDTQMDLGVICEYAYDERGNQATTSFDNDMMIGLRWLTNSLSSIELLASYRQDLSRQSRVFTTEVNGRITDRIKLFIDTVLFSEIASDDYLYAIRDDDYLSIELRYYF